MSKQPAPSQSYIDDDEISLKELILKLKEFWFELWRYWWIVILFVIPFAAYMVYSSITAPITYPANLTFMLNEDNDGGGLGAAAGVLSSFGLGGIGGAGEFNLEKMLELVRSRKIMQTILLKKSTISSKEDYFANHIIDLYDYHEEWVDDTTGLKDFKFSHDSIDIFSRPENSALKQMHGHMIGNADKGIKPMLESSISETTGIMTLSVISENEDLSINILEDIFKELSDYYVAKSIEKQQYTYDAIKSKTDSIYKELRSAEYTLANYKDTNRGLYQAKNQLKQGQLMAKIEILYKMYGESVKNQEMAEFGLRNNTPVVQIIDSPIPPIKPSEKSLLKNLIIGCFIGGFLGACYIIGRKIIREAIATP